MDNNENKNLAEVSENTDDRKLDISDTSLNVNSAEERPGIGYEILGISING